MLYPCPELRVTGYYDPELVAREWNRLAPREEIQPGPWDQEPDYVISFYRPEHYRGVILRQPMWRHLNGYFGVGREHPCYGKTVGECILGTCDGGWCDHSLSSVLEAHGGLTFEGGHIHNFAHFPPDLAGLAERFWFFGFDCAHAGDLAPGMAHLGLNDGVYRDQGYVQAEVNRGLATLESLEHYYNQIQRVRQRL